MFEGMRPPDSSRSPGYAGELDTANTRARRWVRYVAWAVLAVLGWLLAGLALIRCTPTQERVAIHAAHGANAACHVVAIATDDGTVREICVTEGELAWAFEMWMRARLAKQDASL